MASSGNSREHYRKKKRQIDSFKCTTQSTGQKSESFYSSFKELLVYNHRADMAKGQIESEVQGLGVATSNKYVTLTCLLYQGKGIVGEGVEL